MSVPIRRCEGLGEVLMLPLNLNFQLRRASQAVDSFEER